MDILKCFKGENQIIDADKFLKCTKMISDLKYLKK